VVHDIIQYKIVADKEELNPLTAMFTDEEVEIV
jgi:hypothetical protein